MPLSLVSTVGNKSLFGANAKVNKVNRWIKIYNKYEARSDLPKQAKILRRMLVYIDGLAAKNKLPTNLNKWFSAERRIQLMAYLEKMDQHLP